MKHESKKRMWRMPPAENNVPKEQQEMEHSMAVSKARQRIQDCVCFTSVSIDRHGNIHKAFSVNLNEARVGDLATMHASDFAQLNEIFPLAQADLVNAQAEELTHTEGEEDAQ